MSTQKRGGKHTRRTPKTPDPRSTKPVASEDMSEAAKLHQKPCRFWRIGRCNWGWGCRFLHGTSTSEDPRRPEYRGPAVDFTQFPGPMAAGHFSPQSPLHADDQNRTKPIRNPVVKIVIGSQQAGQYVRQVQEALLRASVDVLREGGDGDTPMTKEQVNEKLQQKHSDFILFLDVGGFYLFPDEVPVTIQNVGEVVKRKWDLTINNLSADYIELLTGSELEAIITKLTTLDNISANVCELQNETANVMASLSLNNCRAQPEQIQQLRQKLANFFGKLNLANSIVADMPLYMPVQETRGEIVHVTGQPPNGLSFPMQRMLAYIIGENLTQLHMCLSHVNKMLGEFVMAPTTYFAMASGNSAALHPTPLCPPSASLICSEEPQTRGRMELGRRIEPEVTVEMGTPYSISFREGHGLDVNPFSQYSRYGHP